MVSFIGCGKKNDQLTSNIFEVEYQLFSKEEGGRQTATCTNLKQNVQMESGTKEFSIYKYPNSLYDSECKSPYTSFHAFISFDANTALKINKEYTVLEANKPVAKFKVIRAVNKESVTKELEEYRSLVKSLNIPQLTYNRDANSDLYIGLNDIFNSDYDSSSHNYTTTSYTGTYESGSFQKGDKITLLSPTNTKEIVINENCTGRNSRYACFKSEFNENRDWLAAVTGTNTKMAKKAIVKVSTYSYDDCKTNISISNKSEQYIIFNESIQKKGIISLDEELTNNMNAEATIEFNEKLPVYIGKQFYLSLEDANFKIATIEIIEIIE